MSSLSRLASWRVYGGRYFLEKVGKNFWVGVDWEGLCEFRGVFVWVIWEESLLEWVKVAECGGGFFMRYAEVAVDAPTGRGRTFTRA